MTAHGFLEQWHDAEGIVGSGLLLDFVEGLRQQLVCNRRYGVLGLWCRLLGGDALPVGLGKISYAVAFQEAEHAELSSLLAQHDGIVEHAAVSAVVAVLDGGQHT